MPMFRAAPSRRIPPSRPMGGPNPCPLRPGPRIGRDARDVRSKAARLPSAAWLAALALGGLIAGPVWSQPAGAPSEPTMGRPLSAPVSASAARPDPADARAAVPAAVYRSPFVITDRRTADSAVGPWRDANDRVARIGGWRAYAREAAAGAASSATPSPSVSPSPLPGGAR